MKTQKTLLAGLCAVLALSMTTGCAEECVDRFDCAGKGENYACVDNVCVLAEPPVEEDAGETTDAGELPDAGPQDAGTDAGEVPDAGDMDAGPTDAGPDCTVGNPSCTGPFRCVLPPDGDAGVCRALWIGVTEATTTSTTPPAVDAGFDLDGGIIDAGTPTPVVETTHTAYVFPFNGDAMDVQLGSLGTRTRFPRFSPSGNAVVYVSTPSAGPPDLIRFGFGEAGAPEKVLATSAEAGTTDFVQVEYAPSTNVLWTRVSAMNTRDGIQYVPGSGGAVKTALPQNAGYGDWIDTDEFAFGGGNLGRHSLADGGSRILTVDDAAEPTVSPDGQRIAYLVPDPAVTDVFATTLWTISTDGGVATRLAPSIHPVGTSADGGTSGSYGINPSWVRDSSQLAFVRVSYYRNAMGVATLCTPQDPICGGKAGQLIVFQTLDAAGAPTGMETVHGVGVQPSVSPDGSWLAYVITGPTGQSELHVVPITGSGVATDAGFTHTFPELLTGGKDAKPRWQPK